MASNRTARSTNVIAFILLVAGASALTAIGIYVRQAPKIESIEHSAIAKGTQIDSPKPNPTPEVTATAFTPSMVGDDLKLTPRQIQVPAGQDPIVAAVNAYLDAAKVTASDARLASAEVDGDLAHLNFTASFEQTYGSLDERTLLQGICATVGQFPNVARVQFEVDGRPLDTLGNVDLSKPIEVIRDPDHPYAEPTSGNVPPAEQPKK